MKQLAYVAITVTPTTSREVAIGTRETFTLTPKGAKLAAYGRHKVCP